MSAIQHDVWRLINEGQLDRGARFDLAVVAADEMPAQAIWSSVEIVVPAGQVTVVGLSLVADESGGQGDWGVEIGHLLTDDDRTTDSGHRPSLLTNAMSFANLGDGPVSTGLLLTVQPGGGEAAQYGLPYADRLTLDPGVAGACGLRFTPLVSVGADPRAASPSVEVDWVDGQQGVLMGTYPADGALGDAGLAIRLGTSILADD